MIGSRPDCWSRIFNFLLWCTRVRTTAVKRPDGHIWIAILALRRRASGRLTDLSFSWNLERNQKLIEYWEASGHAAETSGRMQAGTETSRYSMGSGRNEHFVRTDDAGLSSVRTGWHVVWTDGIVDRWASGRLTGNLEFFWLAGRNNWHHSKSGIPIYSIFTLKWFCPNTEWGQNTNT
jgi:hypothetical protein